MQLFDTNQFQQDLLAWYRSEKRDLPWRRENDPYRIWVSEIMLQQTKVDTVIPYYERFMNDFPTLQALAEAPEEKVLKAWEGLGYYSRARNLHAAVKEVQSHYGGRVPDSEKEIHQLKGVGPYTAGAVLSIAYQVPAPAVDGNVMRVLSRLFSMYDDITKASTRKMFEEIIRDIISEEDPSSFNQALMELGAVICTPTSPGCLLCPVADHCRASAEGVQELLPVKPKKKAPKTVHLQSLVLSSEDAVLVEKRPEKGLLANLWQFPMLADGEPEAMWTNYAKQRDGTVRNLTYVAHIRHVFSHLVWEIDVYKAEGSISSPEERQAWMTEAQMDEAAFPVSHQKIREEVQSSSSDR
ncbi:A/G-specific adenine glycosylase [Alkalicoccus urumqiensis]|uniref:A/G-specific adenine glycosylase n=1 Tax=Alkalicoccus urumqiensis TaxID=1548213 RepID=UPI001FE158E8|nr:A/G-specific adenine glycosylase [Alkalicoccus urumqiensis]